MEGNLQLTRDLDKTNRCLFNTFLMLSQTGLGAAFVTMMYRGHFRETGILEWTLSYTGAIWMASFAGYTRSGWSLSI